MNKIFMFFIVCLMLHVNGVVAQYGNIPAHEDKQHDSIPLGQGKIVKYGRGISYDLKESTTATAIAGEEKLSHKKSINNSNLLYGLIPGLQVLQNSGNAWDDAATLKVRGIGTTNSTSPLILVDGFERSLDQISADEIESISVLKDASATALYGIRGGNGVILVRTKRGVAGKPQINFSYQFNVSTPQRLPDFVDGYTYANALNEALVNDGQSPRYSDAELQAFQSQAYPDVYPNVDWWDEALRDYSTGHNIAFSVRGGNESVRYFTLLNYLNDDGILQPTQDNDTYSTQFKYSKLNIRTNLDINVSRTTNVQLNLFGNFAEHNRPGTTTDYIFSALYYAPSGAFPIKTANNIWGGTSVYSYNPIAYISGTGYARSQSRNMFADMKLTQDLNSLLHGLSAGFKIGLDNSASYWDNNTKSFGYESSVLDWDTDEISYTSLRNEGSLSFSRSVGSSVNHYNFNLFTNYENEWEKHKLSSTLMYNMDKTISKGQNTSRAFMDIVAQMHYVYNNRYIVDASLSGSASSILEPGHRWGLFPSVGAAWLVSEEPFAKKEWLNLLKLRASYGIAGRADYNPNSYFDIYDTGNSFYFGRTPTSTSGLKITQLGISDLTYEKSHKLNIGLDFIAFNKLSMTLEAFYDRRTDILVSGDNVISNVYGLTAADINDGIVDNFGLESEIRWTDYIGKMKYELGGMLTFNKNKIIKMNETYRPYDYLKRTGKSVGQIFGYEVIGIFQTQEEIDNSSVTQTLSEVHPGDLIYKDQNGDGIIDSYDQIALGHTTFPEIYYSFDLNMEYKGVGVYALFQGTGRISKTLSTTSLYWPMINNSTISWEYYNNRWISAEETPNAKYPRLTSEGSANNYVTNSLWVADASYLKLRTLELYYNVPSKLLGNKALKGAKIFVRGHDLLTFDKIKTSDPENVGVNYPSMTQYAFGFNLSF